MTLDAVCASFHSEIDMQIAFTSNSAAQFLEMLKLQPVNVCVVDLLLPDLDGIELLRRIKALRRHERVLLCSSSSDVDIARRSINAGADGFIDKDSSLEQLFSAIRTIHNGNISLSINFAKQIAKDHHVNSSSLDCLGQREFEVFNLIARGFSTNEISQKLFLDQRTVSTHKRRILEKLGLTRASEIVAYALRHSLLD